VPVVTRNFLIITPKDLGYNFGADLINRQNATNGDPETYAQLVYYIGDTTFDYQEGFYFPVAFKLLSPPTWFYRIDVTASIPNPIFSDQTKWGVYLLFQVSSGLSLGDIGGLIINQPVIKRHSTGKYSPARFQETKVHPSSLSEASWSDYTSILYSSSYLNDFRLSGSKRTISFYPTAMTSTVLDPEQSSASTKVVDSAFNGLLTPKISSLQVSSELYIILQFLLIRVGSSGSIYAGTYPIVNIWDISMTIPSPEGEVYVWNEMTGLSGPQTGSSSKVFDNSLTTYETVYPFSPRRGVLVVYPTKRTVPRLRVYASSSGGQTLSFYNGVDTLPPTGSPTAQVSIGSTAGWYTVLSDQTEIQWSYLLV